jgi:hypothetical protein
VQVANPKIEEYMIKHDIAGTYGTNYTKLQPMNSSQPTLKEFRGSILDKVRQICIETGIGFDEIPAK